MDQQSSRRFFLDKAAASIGLALTAPAIAALVAGCESDETTPTPPVGTTYTVDITTIPELSAVGGITLTFVGDLNGGSPVFISRIAQNTFVVFSSICTHASCEVDPPAASGSNIVCSCHKAEYSSSDGSVLKQPTTGSATNLPRFANTFDPATSILTITA